MRKSDFTDELRKLLDKSDSNEINEAKVEKLRLELDEFIAAARLLRWQRVRCIDRGPKPDFWLSVQAVIDLIPEEWQ